MFQEWLVLMPFPTWDGFCFLHREDKEYLVDDDGVIRSVENLRQLQNVKWVVLSLGGNVPWEATRRGGG